MISVELGRAPDLLTGSEAGHTSALRIRRHPWAEVASSSAAPRIASNSGSSSAITAR